MSDWGSYIDRQIRKAMEDGEFSNLPGEGKPLDLSQDEHTPDQLKMAYKILRENDLAPDWMLMGRELDGKIEALMSKVRRAFKTWSANIHDPAAGSAQRIEAERNWQAAQSRLTKEAAELNSAILTYNLKVPAGVQHKLTLNLAREINRLAQA